MSHFKVIEVHSLGSRQPSDGILAAVLENDVCTYAACIPDISRGKAFVDEPAHRCSESQRSPMHLLDAVLSILASSGGGVTIAALLSFVLSLAFDAHQAASI